MQTHKTMGIQQCCHINAVGTLLQHYECKGRHNLCGYCTKTATACAQCQCEHDVNHNEGSKRRQQTSKNELRDRFPDKNSEGAEL